jgi:hypothetical protein
VKKLNTTNIVEKNKIINDLISPEKILKNIDDFEITSKKDYFSVSSKTKELTKEYSGIPATKQEKYIIQTEYVKSLNAMKVNDVKISKNYRNTGAGKALYKIAIKDAFDKKLNFVSDNSISESALRVYKSLEKEGFEISYNKNVTTKKRDFGNDKQRGNQIVSNDPKIPVVTIKNKFTKEQKVIKEKIVEDIKTIDTPESLKRDPALPNEVVTKINEAVVKFIQEENIKLVPTKEKPLSLQMQEILLSDKYETPYIIRRVAEDNKIPVERLINYIFPSASKSALELNAYSQSMRYLKTKLDPTGQIFGQSINPITHVIKRLDNLRRGLLVTRIATAVRNYVSQSSRITLDSLQKPNGLWITTNS